MIHSSVDSAQDLPLKTSVYGTLCGLLHHANESFGEGLVKYSVDVFNTYLIHLAQCKPASGGELAVHNDKRLEPDAMRVVCNETRRRVRLLARFFAELTNAHVVQPLSLLNFLSLLIDTALDALLERMQSTSRASTTSNRRSSNNDDDDDDDDNDDNDNDDKNNNDNDADAGAQQSKTNRGFSARADFYASLALHTLAWCGGFLQQLKPTEVAELWQQYESFFARRTPPPRLGGLVPLGDDNDGVGVGGGAEAGARDAPLRCDVDWLELRWRQLRMQRENGWQLGAALNAHRLFEHQLKDVPRVQLSLDAVTVPDMRIDSECAYPLPRPALQLMSETERYAALTAADAAAIAEYVPDVLDSFSSDHRGAAKFLGVLPLPSASHAGSADVVAAAAQLVVESIFDQLLALPHATFPMPYYAAVLVSLCRSAQQTVPRALGRCVMRLYKRSADVS